jgi:nucleoid DNA-binding protein
MAFSFYGYQPERPMENPLNNVIKNLLGGYTEATKARYLQPNMEEQLKKSKLYNQYYGPNMESQIGLRGAQAGHLGAMTEGLNISNPFLRQKLEQEQEKRAFELQNPFFGQTGTSGDLGRLLYLQEMIKKHPELGNQINGAQQSGMSPEELSQQGKSFVPSINQQAQQPIPQEQGHNFDYNSLIQNAFNKVAQGKNQQFAPSNIGKLQQEYAKAKSGINPVTNQPFENDQEKEEFLAPYSEKLGGLKSGEHYLYDPENHEKIGIQRPFTPKERESEEGSVLFNQFYPDINKGFKDFIGKDSVKNFIKYANDYGKNEEATKKINDLLYASNLVTAGVINEQSTLNAGKTNVTFRKILESFPKSDIPNLIQRYGKELKLPSTAFYQANQRFQDKVSNSRQLAQTQIPQFKKVYFHPDKYLKSTEEKPKESENKFSGEKEKSHYSDEDIKHTAKIYGISEEEVHKRIKEEAVRKKTKKAG